VSQGLVSSSILEPYFVTQFKQYDDLTNNDQKIPHISNSAETYSTLDHHCDKEEHFCIAIYRFDAIDQSTMSVNQGEKLRICQTHDDNMNQDWWFLERVVRSEQRGFVPASYVRLISEATTLSS
jgi:hypothetical protein